jgi:hypothetical protein
MPQATPAESEDNALGFSFPAIGGKKLTAAFDGGRLTSDGGVAAGAGRARDGDSPSACGLHCRPARSLRG